MWARKQKLARKSSRFVVVKHEPVKITRQALAKERREDLKAKWKHSEEKKIHEGSE